MEQINNYNVLFSNVMKVNTVIYNIHRETLQRLACSDYKLYYNIYSKGMYLFDMVSVEQAYKLTSTYNDPERMKIKLGDYILKTQKAINELKLYCDEDFLVPLQSLEMKVLLLLRDINQPQSLLDIQPLSFIQSLSSSIDL